MGRHEPIELVVETGPIDSDLEVFECEDLDELELEVRELCRDPRDRVCLILSFRRARDATFTLPRAAELCARVLSGRRIAGRFVFDSESARAAAERVIPGRAPPARYARIGRFQIIIEQGDIALVRADAIVNASNVRLELGAGVSGAIRRATQSPEALQAAMFAKAPIEPGDVVSTPSFGLPSPTVLHAATATGGERAVERALQNVIEIADAKGIRTIALPALGTGTGGVPLDACAAVTRSVLIAHSEEQGTLERVHLVLYDRGALDAFATAMSALRDPKF